MAKTETKATKARRKPRTIEEQIADLKAKQKAIAERERGRLQKRYDEANERAKRYEGLFERAQAEREDIRSQIEALDTETETVEADAQ